MKVSDLINHLEAFQREYGNIEVDCVAETLMSREQLIQHIVTMEDMLQDPENEAGLQVESELTAVAYAPGQKRLKLMSERF